MANRRAEHSPQEKWLIEIYLFIGQQISPNLFVVGYKDSEYWIQFDKVITPTKPVMRFIELNSIRIKK